MSQLTGSRKLIFGSRAMHCKADILKAVIFMA